MKHPWFNHKEKQMLIGSNIGINVLMHTFCRLISARKYNVLLISEIWCLNKLLNVWFYFRWIIYILILQNACELILIILLVLSIFILLQLLAICTKILISWKFDESIKITCCTFIDIGIIPSNNFVYSILKSYLSLTAEFCPRLSRFYGLGIKFSSE